MIKEEPEVPPILYSIAMMALRFVYYTVFTASHSPHRLNFWLGGCCDSFWPPPYSFGDQLALFSISVVEIIVSSNPFINPRPHSTLCSHDHQCVMWWHNNIVIHELLVWVRHPTNGENMRIPDPDVESSSSRLESIRNRFDRWKIAPHRNPSSAPYKSPHPHVIRLNLWSR